MFNTILKKLFKSSKVIPCASLVCGLSYTAAAAALPEPVLDLPLMREKQEQVIVLAGGCFWGVQAVFQHVKGVQKAVSGYAGGDASTAQYDVVSSGSTQHAEAVEVTYDASQVTLGSLLQVYFSVAHNPTDVDRQGPDVGTQYRSEVFYTSPEQEKIVKAYIEQLQRAAAFEKPIATKVSSLQKFYPAEGYHQDYARLHPNNPYIVIHDLPKIKRLKQEYPALYVER